ncbi:MAG: hypothetical protein AAF846_20715 [Chloroflexota bacterium]
MNFDNYVAITEATANEILQRADVNPSTLYSNGNGTFTAVFNDQPMLKARALVESADPNIKIELPEPFEYDQPVVEPNLKSEVTFGFIAEPILE